MADVLMFPLSKPIMINGEEVKELPYDFENMTARDKLNAGKTMKVDGNSPGLEELDADYHLYLFAQAVARADASIAHTDVLRMSAKDAQKAGALARDFFYLGSVE